MGIFGYNLDQIVDYIILIGALFVAIKNIFVPIIRTSKFFNEKFNKYADKRIDKRVEATIEVAVPKVVKPLIQDLEKRIGDLDTKMASIDKQNKVQASTLKEIDKQVKKQEEKLDVIENQNKVQETKLATMDATVNAVRAGTRDSLRAEMLKIYYKYVDYEKIPAYDKHTFDEMYKSYQKVGGNSFIMDVNQEMSKWDVVKTQKDIPGFSYR